LVGEEPQRLDRIPPPGKARARSIRGNDVRPLDAAHLAARQANPQRGDARVGGIGGVGEEVDHGAEPLARIRERGTVEQLAEEEERPLPRALAVARTGRSLPGLRHANSLPAAAIRTLLRGSRRGGAALAGL